MKGWQNSKKDPRKGKKLGSLGGKFRRNVKTGKGPCSGKAGKKTGLEILGERDCRLV